MIKTIKYLRGFKRAGFGVAAALLTAAVLTPALVQPSKASAAQVTSRKIVIGSSATSAATTYALTFTPVTTAQELIVDFCSNSPLVGDTCSFTAATVPTVGVPVSSVGTAASVGTGTPVHTIKVTGLTMTAATPFTITFTSGITNPTTAVSYYARILTYATGNAAGYTPGNVSPATPVIGTDVDTGGDALATTSNILVTAKVFETLSFCIFQTACGTPANLTLGDPVTGALSSSTPYVNSTAQYTLATNAGSGVNVTMTGQTLCRATTLTFANCPTGASPSTISAVGSTAVVRTVNTEQFGMCVNAAAPLTINATYVDSSAAACAAATLGNGVLTNVASTFGFNDTSAANGTNNASGSQLMSSTGAVPAVTSNFGFLGDIAATTEAGIYQSSLNLVATGTY